MTGRISYSKIWLTTATCILCGILLLVLDDIAAQPDETLLRYAALLLGCSLCSILLLPTGIRKPRISTVDLLAALYMIGSLLNIQTVSPIASPDRMVTLLYSALLYLNLRILLPADKRIAKVLTIVLFICGVSEAMTGIRQILRITYSNHSLFRTTGTFFNPGPYGGYLAVILSMVIAYLWHHYRSFVRLSARLHPTLRIMPPRAACYIGCLTAAIAITLILPATMNRAALCAVAVAVLILLATDKTVRKTVSEKKKRNPRHFRYSVLSIVIILLTVSLTFYLAKRRSADARLLMWGVSASVIAEHPWTGIGIGAFPGTYAQHPARYFESHPDSSLIPAAGCPEYGFNEYLQIGAEQGVISLLIFLLLCGFALRNLFRKKSIMAYGMTALLVFAFFSYPFRIEMLRILLLLFLATGAETSPSETRKWQYNRGFLALLTVALSLTSLFATEGMAERIKAFNDQKDVSFLYDMELYKDACIDYKALYPSLNDQPEFLFGYGRALHKLHRYEESLIILKQGTIVSSDPMFYNIIGNNYAALGNFHLAEQYYIKSHHILPNRIYPHYLLMKLYQQYGYRDKALQKAREIIAFSPKIISEATRELQREAREYINKNI